MDMFRPGEMIRVAPELTLDFGSPTAVGSKMEFCEILGVVHKIAPEFGPGGFAPQCLMLPNPGPISSVWPSHSRDRIWREHQIDVEYDVPLLWRLDWQGCC